MSPRPRLLILGGTALLLGAVSPAASEDSVEANLMGAETTVNIPPQAAKDLVKRSQPPAGGGGIWTQRKFEYLCTYQRQVAEDGQSCRRCPDPEASRYTVLSRVVTDGVPAQTWTEEGTTCLTPADAGELGASAITPAQVLTEFRNLTWPKADLMLEPSDGLTLVNMATNAYTTNPGPLTQTVTLLGQRITIEATPDNWTWHWGDGSTETTTDSGQPQPHGTVTHAYRRASDDVEVRVDVTYRGRYQVNGGQWQEIPDTATVAGESTSIEVKEAVVQLIR